jgi:Txe/YoeB family toxin of Txe-Axe toxin-antitoxin module
MKHSIFWIFAILLFISGCVTPRTYECKIDVKFVDNNKDERLKEIDNLLENVTQKFGFKNCGIIKNKLKGEISYYYKRNLYTGKNISVFYFHDDSIIRIATLSKTEEVKELTYRILEELKKITNKKYIIIEEEYIPRPWFDSV